MDTEQHATRTLREVADAITAHDQSGEQLRRWRDGAVHDARAAGMTWEQIGDALGVTRQRALAIGQRPRPDA